MKTGKLYLPFEVDFILSDQHSELIERYGTQGLGIYFMVLMELRNHEGYRCRLSTIKCAARRCMADSEMLESVLHEFGLFEFHECGERVLVSSPYIDRVMQPFEEKKRCFSSAVNKKTVTVERAANGRFTAKHREIKNKIEIKTKTKTTSTTKKKTAAAAKSVDADVVVVNGVNPKAGHTSPGCGNSAPSSTGRPVPATVEVALQQPEKRWEEYLQQAIADEQWMRLLAMNSGVGHLFTKHRQLAVDTFRQHVLLQGNDTALHSTEEVKAYLANFMRPGTPTQKRVAALLRQCDNQAESCSPYRFETVDPLTGERSYFGNAIPKEAPPRPHNDAVWASGIKQWI